jgi:hypothetical protein
MIQGPTKYFVVLPGEEQLGSFGRVGLFKSEELVLCIYIIHISVQCLGGLKTLYY